MTVQAQPTFIEYIGNGITTEFACPFRVMNESEVYVFFDEVEVSPAEFTVLGVNAPTCSVQFLTPPTSSVEILIKRIVPLTQETNYQPYDAFPAESHENALDKLTMLIQQQAAGGLEGAIHIPDTEAGAGIITELPTITNRAGKLVSFDNDGNVIVVIGGSGGGGGVTAHSDLSGLKTGNDHPQYLLTGGGQMLGALLLVGNPTTEDEAASKGYVDGIISGVSIQNITSDVVGDAQLTVSAGWNAQANASGITRATNEITFYRWPSDGDLAYRYEGNQLIGPWVSTDDDWLPSAAYIEAPEDGDTYGRMNKTWAKVLNRGGGTMTGQITLPGGATGAQALQYQTAQGLVDSGVAAHVALPDPHTQYLTPAEGDARYDPTGEADAAISDHVAAPDPHTQYYNSTRGDVRYQERDEKGAPNGYCPLDATDLVPVINLPIISLSLEGGWDASGNTLPTPVDGGVWVITADGTLNVVPADGGSQVPTPTLVSVNEYLLYSSKTTYFYQVVPNFIAMDARYVQLAGSIMTGQLGLPGSGNASQAMRRDEIEALDTAAIAAHVGASDPHTQYLTAAEGNAAYDPINAASTAVANHVGLPDPHTQYLTAADGNAAYDPIGAADAAVANHVGLPDPHTQYTTSTELNAAIAALKAAANDWTGANRGVPIAVAYAGSITLDVAARNNFDITMSGPITMQAPSGNANGRSGYFAIYNNSGSDQTLTFAAGWRGADSAGQPPDPIVIPAGYQSIFPYVCQYGVTIITPVLSI